MSEDVYLVYRILERIMQANSITESVGITVRSTTPEDCYRMTGNKEVCAVVGDLPDVKAKDSLYAWALQVVSSTNGMPNAYADGQNSNIRIIKSLENALSDKPMALACVVGHELAHITLKHRKQKVEKMYELDSEASAKISSAIKNAKKVQKTQEVFAAIAMGLNAGAGTYQGALSNYQIATSMQADSAEGARALDFIKSNYAALRESAPQSLASFESMNGLGAGLVKRTMKDINQYLDDYSNQLMNFSRQKELEADAKGMEYIAKAGIDPKACLDVVELVHRSSPVKTTSAEDSHPGENERKSQMEKTLSEMPNQLRNRYKMPQTKVPVLPYVYDTETQIVKISPAGTEGLQAGKNNKSKAVEAMLGN